MAPKKAAQVKDKKELTPQCGLFAENCSLPGWDDQDNALENWGGEITTPATSVDPSTLFVDTEFTSNLEKCFGSSEIVAEWRRPSAYFSPFKPVVFRNPLQTIANPYEFVGKNGGGGGDENGTTPAAAPHAAHDEDEDSGLPTSKEDAIAMYRRMRPLVVPQEITNLLLAAVGDVPVLNQGHSSPVRRTRKRHDTSHHSQRNGEQGGSNTYFMRAFTSVLALINHEQRHIPAGHYAWELIYPQLPNTTNPMYNPWGKYAVKLFVGGAYRRVIVDDRLPVDRAGNALLTVTEQKEIWPAILAKAILKALGPSLESLFVASPMSVASYLLPGWCPQRLHVRSSVLQTLSALRNTTDPNHDVIVSACVSDPTVPCDDVPIQQAELSAIDGSIDQSAASLLQKSRVALGNTLLPHRCLFAVLDVKPYNTTTLIRLCAPHVSWNGQYAYDRAVWTHAFESAIHFSPQKDRDGYALQGCGWVDFWVSFEEFTEHFDTLLLWHNVLSGKSWSNFRQYTPPAPVEAAPAAGGKAAPAAANVAAVAPANALAPVSFHRWLYARVPEGAGNRRMLVVFHGIPKTPPSTPPPTAASATAGSETPSHPSLAAASEAAPRANIVVEAYKWSSSSPLCFVTSLSLHLGITHAEEFQVPPGSHAFRITANHLPVGYGVSVMSDGEFALGDEKEIVQGMLQVYSISDAGTFAPHAQGLSTIWFKRLISLKHPTKVNFVLTTLPAKGTDLAQHRSTVAEAGGAGGAGGKGAKAPAPPPKGGAKGSVATEAVVEPLDEAEHVVPIHHYARLILVNLDTNATMKDTALKLLHVTLLPNTKGYLLMAYATIPRGCSETYGRGYWKVSSTSDRPFDSFETRGFEDITSRQSEYVHNDYSMLFKYNFTVSEPATGTVQLTLQESWGIPFHITLLHNDKEIDVRRDVKGSCMFEHVTLQPSDKAVVSVYSLHCLLDSKFTTEWEERRRVQVVQLFQQNCIEQEATLRKKQTELTQKLKEARPLSGGPEGASAPITSGATSPRPGVSSPSQPQQLQGSSSLTASTTTQQPLFSIPFQLLLHLSTNKVDVKEDNTIQEHLMQVKASWAKKDNEGAGAGGAPAGKGGKPPAKGQVVQDESQLRQQKSKESRERFLSNLKGVFLPYAKDGKVFLEFTDEPTMNKAPLLLPSQFASASPEASTTTDPSPCVALATTPAVAEVVVGGKGAAAAASAAAAAAQANSNAAATTSLAPHVTQHFKTITQDMFDNVNNAVLHLRNAKQKITKAQSDAATEYWALHRPDRAVGAASEAAASGADDDKNKKPPAKGAAKK